VLYYDASTDQIVRIPATELGSGAIQVLLRSDDSDVGQLVWMSATDDLQAGDICHPPFDYSVREYIALVCNTFAEHRSISLEEWEEGFRRDRNAAEEIGLWVHAANVYNKVASDEPSPGRRREIYRCIVACLTTDRDNVWHVFVPKDLSRREAEDVVNCYFGGAS
jgi:hypothetical protein